MGLQSVDVDHSLRERLIYDDNSFPLITCTDEYCRFVDRTVNCHWHDVFEFGIVLSGEVDYYINDTHMKLHTGDAVFINVNAMHMSTEHSGSQNAKMFVLLFPPSMFSGNIDSTIYSEYFHPIINSTLQGFRVEASEPGNQIRDILWEIKNSDPAASGRQLQCLYLLVKLWQCTITYLEDTCIDLCVQRSEGVHQQRAKRLLSYVHQHYAENISIQDIADAAGISRTECFRCFKRATNKNPVAYINGYRLAQAARLLRETDSSIIEISSSCGFSNSSYFSKLFRDTFGLSPMRFRKAGGAAP